MPRPQPPQCSTATVASHNNAKRRQHAVTPTSHRLWGPQRQRKLHEDSNRAKVVVHIGDGGRSSREMPRLLGSSAAPHAPEAGFTLLIGGDAVLTAADAPRTALQRVHSTRKVQQGASRPSSTPAAQPLHAPRRRALPARKPQSRPSETQRLLAAYQEEAGKQGPRHMKLRVADLRRNGHTAPPSGGPAQRARRPPWSRPAAENRSFERMAREEGTKLEKAMLLDPAACKPRMKPAARSPVRPCQWHSEVTARFGAKRTPGAFGETEQRPASGGRSLHAHQFQPARRPQSAASIGRLLPYTNAGHVALQEEGVADWTRRRRRSEPDPYIGAHASRHPEAHMLRKGIRAIQRSASDASEDDADTLRLVPVLQHSHTAQQSWSSHATPRL